MILSGHRATAHRHLDPDRAAYRMRARTYQAAADKRSRRTYVSAGYRLLGVPQGLSADGVAARVSEFTAAMSARRPSDGADPYPFRDGV